MGFILCFPSSVFQHQAPFSCPEGMVAHISKMCLLILPCVPSLGSTRSKCNGCQLIWIWNHLGDTPGQVWERVFQRGLIDGERLILNRRHHPIQCKKGETGILVSLLPDCGPMDQTMLLTPCFPTKMDCILSSPEPKESLGSATLDSYFVTSRTIANTQSKPDRLIIMSIRQNKSFNYTFWVKSTYPPSTLAHRFTWLQKEGRGFHPLPK